MFTFHWLKRVDWRRRCSRPTTAANPGPARSVLPLLVPVLRSGPLAVADDPPACPKRCQHRQLESGSMACDGPNLFWRHSTGTAAMLFEPLRAWPPMPVAGQVLIPAPAACRAFPAAAPEARAGIFRRGSPRLRFGPVDPRCVQSLASVFPMASGSSHLAPSPPKARIGAGARAGRCIPAVATRHCRAACASHKTACRKDLMLLCVLLWPRSSVDGQLAAGALLPRRAVRVT